MNDEPDKYFKKVAKGQGHQKILNYFREVVDSQSFQEFLKRAKLKYKIPEDGFTDSTKMYLFPPKRWVLKNNEEKIAELENEIEEICRKYHLHFLDDSTIKTYLFYCVIDFPVPEMSNVCLVSDLVEEKTMSLNKKIRESNDLLFPIAIRLSPRASERDILEYVKATYEKRIAPLQNKYRNEEVKIGKFKRRKSSIIERNEFIYQNRNLPRKAILEMLYKKYGFDLEMDEGYMGKIISMEKKRRKEL
jgi:hypothetical protein